ncbi:MAG TPA: HAD family hydrolase [Natronoarchaeum rubrum]|nr:HAD family hydrolase [Natronoarchaeum rubrum]
MPPDAVVFDLDYTLAVPRRDRATLLAEALDAVDAPQASRQEYLDAHGRNLTGESRAPIFAELFEGRATDADPEAAADAYRAAIADALEPVDGAAGLVADLREDYRVGLLTNGPVRAQHDKIETLGWTDLFDATVVTGELPAGKPDERAFRAVLGALGIDADAAVYVGDEVDADVRGATEAGMTAIQILSPEGPAPDERADAHVDRAELVAQLPDVLAELPKTRA